MLASGLACNGMTTGESEGDNGGGSGGTSTATSGRTSTGTSDGGVLQDDFALLFDDPTFHTCAEHELDYFGEYQLENNTWNTASLAPGSFTSAES